MPVDLEGLGKAINETIALKQILLKKEREYSDIIQQIKRNETEIARLNSLITQTKELEKRGVALKEDMASNQEDLQQRLNKLTANGVDLEPLTNPNKAKGFMTL